jgi:hypothetical protein
MITRREVRLPSEADLIPVTANIELQNPIENDFAFEGMCGSAGGEPSKFEFRCGIADIIEVFDRLSKTPQAAPDSIEYSSKVSRTQGRSKGFEEGSHELASANFGVQMRNALDWLSFGASLM